MYAQIERERSNRTEVIFPPQQIDEASFKPKGKRIYLAHSSNKKKEGKVLQKLLEKAGHEVINPFDHDAHSRNLTERWNKMPSMRNDALASEIVLKDLTFINSSDVVVAQVLEGMVGIGTPMEIVYASTSGIPVFILTTKEHPWLMVHGTIVRTVEQLLGDLKYE